MKRALIAGAGVGIFAVIVAAETANAQRYSPTNAPQTYGSQGYAPQNRGAVRRGAPRNAPLGNPDSPAATGGGSLGYNQNLYNW